MKTERLREELMAVVGPDVPALLDSDVRGQIVRLCRDAGIDFHRTLHVVLRCAWLAQSAGATAPNDKWSETSGGQAEEKTRRFDADPDQIIEVFEKNARGWIKGTSYDREMLGLLVAEMIALNLYLYSGKSAEVDNFVRRAHGLKEDILAEGSKGRVGTLVSMKGRWLKCQDELGERLLALEAIRLRNANIDRMWMKIFGAEYVGFIEQQSRLEICRRKMLLLDLNPELTAAGLEAKLRQIVQKEQKRLDALRLKTSLSLLSDFPKTGKEPLDAEALKSYRQKSKGILREIYLLIHPDLLCQNPAYRNLTEYQKTGLTTLWNEVMALKEEEIGFGPDCLGYRYRAIPMLMDKLDLARSILENAGIDIDPRLIIRGASLAEQIEWLNQSLESLEAAILTAQAEHKVLLEDEETRERETMLVWPEARQAKIKSGYTGQAKAYSAEADKLEEAIKSRLAEEKEDNDHNQGYAGNDGRDFSECRA